MDRDSSPPAHTPKRGPRPLLARLSLLVMGAVGVFMVFSVTSMVSPFFSAIDDHDDQWLERFERLALHTDSQTVHRLLGDPTLVEPCTQQLDGGLCDRLWRYGARGSLSAYGVGLDADGRVVGKYRYSFE